MSQSLQYKLAPKHKCLHIIPFSCRYHFFFPLNAMKCIHFTCETVTDSCSFRTVNNGDVNIWYGRKSKKMRFDSFKCAFS